MDFDFKRDHLGRFLARCSMGHEAIGYWLSDEMGNNAGAIESLLRELELIKSGTKHSLERTGKEWVLSVDREQVTVMSYALFSEQEEDPELSFYDDESQAHCGLDDFLHLLQGWQEFIGH